MCPLDQLVGGFKEIITGYFTVYENLTLGKLIKFRSANVDTEKLARVALKHELHKFLRHKIALLPTMEFGIKISNRLAQDEARVVPAPWLKYHESRETECLPKVGQWNMRNKRMVNGGIVKCTICINFARNAQDNAARGFCRELAQTCNISGMTFSTEPILSVVTYPPEQVERVLKTAYHNLMEKLPPHRKNQDLLIVILLDINESPYGETETPPCGYGDGGESIIIVWDTKTKE